MTTFSVGQGIKDAMDKLAESPQSDEYYLGDREAHCASDKALYIYQKDANRIARIPFLA